ncbi:MAG: phosphatidylserine/phosphatidylglycerophosphate/cardiolipin synthase family protein [Deltaproteobacteria bacterium]|nr:phosphatidylserine/phosphatidylglycerophosphate/cardiolipin synthase family protein [Deltaproteobacteria bacterium]
MNPYQYLFVILFGVISLVGCGLQSGSPPISERRSEKPSVPPLKQLSHDTGLAQVFGPPEAYEGSPLEEVGRQGLFEAHHPKANQIAVLENGDASFAARVQLLENAKKSIRIQALIFAGDESGLHIAEILKRKKAAGLDVRVIVDAPSNLGFQTQWMYFDLKQHDIEVQGYESLYLEWLNEVPIPFLSPARDPEAPDNRYHEKMWIVDGETDHGTAVTGGLNVANAYFRVNPMDPDENWRDQDVIVKGPIVADMVTAFERNFDHFVAIKESRGDLDTDLYWQKTREFLDEVGKLEIPYATRSDITERVRKMAQAKPDLKYEHARSRFFHNRPRLGESYIKQAYRKLIDHARREIIICNAYFIPSIDFVDAIRAAANRGVRVIILSNSPETNDLPAMSMVGRDSYKDILAINEEDRTRENGGRVQIWEWYGRRFDRDRQTEGTIHAKYAVFDRRYALVGSYNLDPRSEKLNSETAVVFQSESLSAKLAKIFYENDLAYSRQVTPEDAAEFNEPTDALYKLQKEFGSLFESEL